MAQKKTFEEVELSWREIAVLERLLNSALKKDNTAVNVVRTGKLLDECLDWSDVDAWRKEEQRIVTSGESAEVRVEQLNDHEQEGSKPKLYQLHASLYEHAVRQLKKADMTVVNDMVLAANLLSAFGIGHGWSKDDDPDVPAQEPATSPAP